MDEDSSDALSPDQMTNHDSPLGSIPQLSPSDMLTPHGDMSPSQVALDPGFNVGVVDSKQELWSI